MSHLSLFLLVAFALATFCLGKDGNIHLTKDHFVLDVTGNQNVPKYDFYMDNNKTEGTYKVQLTQLWEATKEDGKWKKYGPSNIALASLSWAFSDPVDAEDGFRFNITNVVSKKSRWDALWFDNYLGRSNETSFDNYYFGSSNETERPYVKFNVDITDYTWASDDTEALVLVFSFQEEGGNSTAVEKNGDAVFVGDAYFNVTNYAEVTSNDGMKSNITVTTMISEGKINLVYERFAGSLHHDPSFGFLPEDVTSDSFSYSSGTATGSSTTSESTSSSSSTNGHTKSSGSTSESTSSSSSSSSSGGSPWKIILIVVACAVAVGLLVAVICFCVYKRRTRDQYEAI